MKLLGLFSAVSLLVGHAIAIAWHPAAAAATSIDPGGERNDHCAPAPIPTLPY